MNSPNHQTEWQVLDGDVQDNVPTMSPWSTSIGEEIQRAVSKSTTPDRLYELILGIALIY